MGKKRRPSSGSSLSEEDKPKSLKKIPRTVVEMSAEGVDEPFKMIMDKFEIISKQMEVGFSSIRSDMDTFRHEMKCEIQELKQTVTDMETSLQFTQGEVEELKEALRKEREENEKLKTVFKELQAEATDLKEAQIALEQYTRRENLRFNNIPEPDTESSEDCKVTIENIIKKDLNIDTSAIRFHAIHRVGRKTTGRVRPIIVRFLSREDRDQVWSCRRKLKNSESFQDAYITQDYAREIQKERSVLIKAMIRHNEQFPLQKAVCKVVGRQLFIKNSKYNVNNLPSYLSE